MRSIWNGVINFGLVNIPIGMYPATKENQVSFHLLHKKDCGRIKNQRVCSKCGEVLDYDELEKGFEYEKGKYVTVSEQEFKSVKPEETETIAIQGFVDLDDIDPMYFDRPYYLIPSRKSDKVYVLLREALKQKNKAGIAKFVLRTKEYLAAVHANGDALILSTMHFADEIRPQEEMPAHTVKIEKREMEMAQQLIEAMQEEFDPTQYKDTYSEALMKVIDKKLEGAEIKAKPVKHKPTNVLDLMSRLKASLEETGGEKPVSRKRATKAAASKSRKTTSPSSKKSTKTSRGASGKPKLRLVA